MYKFWISIIFSLIAIIISVIAITVTFPSNSLSIDYQGVVACVLSFSVTFLIGWNIWSVIDLKDYKRKYKQLYRTIERETNYLHNKADYNHGLSMCYNSISLASSLSNTSKEICKFQMYLQGAQGIKLLSAMNEFDHCNKLINIMLSAENITPDIQLTDEEKREIVKVLIDIPNKNKLPRLLNLIEINNFENHID